DNVGDVQQIVATRRDNRRLPSMRLIENIFLRFSQDVDQPRGATTSWRSGDQFETERFQTKINLRIHQAARMNREKFHLVRTGKRSVRFFWGLSCLAREHIARPFYSSRVLRDARVFFKSARIWKTHLVSRHEPL